MRCGLEARADQQRCSAQDRGGDRALGKYMSLPTDKFALLDPELIQQLCKGNRYLLSVPRINVRRLCHNADTIWHSLGPFQAVQFVLSLTQSAQLLSVWLEPLVEVEVVASPGRVSILVRPPRPHRAPLTAGARLTAASADPPLLP